MRCLHLTRIQALLLALILVIELAIVTAVVVTQWQHDTAVTTDELVRVSERFAVTLNNTVRLFLHGVLSAASSLGMVDGYVTHDQLAQVLSLNTSTLGALRQVYGWMMPILLQDRPEYERFYGVPITDWNGSVAPPFVSGSRPLYWPFTALSPLIPPLVRIFGLDGLTFEQTRFVILSNFSTMLVMPGTMGVVSNAATKNYGLVFVHKDKQKKGVLLGVLGARELLEYTLEVMQIPRMHLSLAAFAPLQSPQLLFMEIPSVLGDAATLEEFCASPHAGEFFVQNITVLGSMIAVCMRFDDAFAAEYAISTWKILIAVLIPVAFLVIGIVVVVLVRRQHRKDIMMLETDKRRESQLMLGYVSHEIRNPLQTILGMSDLCLEEISEKEELKEAVCCIETIVQSAEFIEHIANDILDMRRIEEGQIALDVKEVPVHLVMESLQRSVRSFSKAEVQFAVSVGEEPSFIHTDRHRLEQILLNFLTNAFKYTDRGTVTLTFAPAGAHSVRFSVADSGRGIPQAMLGSIFEQFKQVEAGDSKRGFGLGLFLSKRIATLLGGTVGVESSEHGSTFWLELAVLDLSMQFDDSAVPLRTVDVRVVL